jgi:hypothetical protein
MVSDVRDCDVLIVGLAQRNGTEHPLSGTRFSSVFFPFGSTLDS